MRCKCLDRLLGRTNQTESTKQPERESPRYEITMYTRYRVVGAFVERRGNIGIGGFCFEGETEYIAGSQVELLFRLPDSHTWIHARGVVIGQNGLVGRLGIRCRFTSLDFHDERILARWLDTMSLHKRAFAA